MSSPKKTLLIHQAPIIDPNNPVDDTKTICNVLAHDRFSTTAASVAQISEEFGYQSEVTFWVLGVAPR